VTEHLSTTEKTQETEAYWPGKEFFLHVHASSVVESVTLTEACSLLPRASCRGLSCSLRFAGRMLSLGSSRIINQTHTFEATEERVDAT